MPIKDNRSDTEFVAIAHFEDDTNEASQTTTIINTANFDNGVTYLFSALRIDANATFEVEKIEESDDAGMSGATTIPTDNLIGALPTLTATDTFNTGLATTGVFGTKQYIQATVKLTLNGDTNATLAVYANKIPEVKPAKHFND